MIKYKAIIADKKDFDTKIIQPIKDNLKEGDSITWLQDADKFYSMDMLSYILKNAYNERYMRYDTEEEFIGYFSNTFITVTPMFFSKISNIIEDKLKELQDNEKVGIKTKVTSESDRGSSGRAFDNTVGDDKQTSTETSKYTMDSRSDNMLDNAKKLAQSKISGEVSLYVASFAELFTTLEIEPDLDKSFTPALIAILSDIALAVTKVGHVQVDDGKGGYIDMIDFQGNLVSVEKVGEVVAEQLKPYTDRIDHIGSNQIVQEDGSEIGFDDDTPQRVYSKKSSDEYRTVKDLTHLTTRGDLYNNVEVGKVYLCNIIGYVGEWACETKDISSATLYGQATNPAGRTGTWRTIAGKDNNGSFNLFPTSTTVATPTIDEHSTSKFYVDNKFKWIPITGDFTKYGSDIRLIYDYGIYYATQTYIKGGIKLCYFNTIDPSGKTEIFLYDDKGVLTHYDGTLIDSSKYSVEVRFG